MSTHADPDLERQLREKMVERQIRARGIRDERVLDALRRIPRSAFAPEVRVDAAHADNPHPIGHGQTISQPYMVALMTELLELAGGERMLEIGTGSGYQTAVLAALGAEVFTVERIPALADRARKTLEGLGYSGVRFRTGDGTLGWPEEAPFDRVLVTAGAPEMPPALEEQLGPGGTLVAPVGEAGAQELIRLRRDGERLDRSHHCHCAFVRLVGRDGWPEETP